MTRLLPLAALLLAGCVAHTAADRCLADSYLCSGSAPDATAATADAPSAPAADAPSAPANDGPSGGQCE